MQLKDDSRLNQYIISERDREILRTLARDIERIAAQPWQAEKEQKWTAHNDLQTEEPLVLIDPENGWHEIVTDADLRCEGALARSWESELRRTIFRGDALKDDKVISRRFTVGYVYSTTGWGVKLHKEGGENNGAYHIDPAIVDYDEDFKKIHYPEIIVDYVASDALLESAHEVFDGILDVARYNQWWWSLGLTWSYIDLRGFENFLCDFIAEPEWMHKMMELLCDGALRKIDFLEQNNLLYSNVGNAYVGSGGFGYTNQLPHGTMAHANEMWGFVESQETVSVSPKMYGEFIFPYHKRIAERFGLNCYGCCEPYEGRWEYVKQLPNLRRVSCSPWSDRSRTAELLGNKYIASHKLSPTPLSMKNMNEDEVRMQLRAAIQCSKGCIPELIMKDNHTLGGNPNNAVRWVEIAREEIARI